MEGLTPTWGLYGNRKLLERGKTPGTMGRRLPLLRSHRWGGVAEFFFSGFFPIKFQMDNKSPLDQLCDKNKVEIATIAAHWMLEISGKQVKISNTRHLGP